MKESCKLALLSAVFMVGLTATASAETVVVKTKCGDAPSSANCDARDPVAQGCDVNTIVVDRVKLFDKKNQRVGVLRLVYSNKCGTFWGRVLSDRGDAFDVFLMSVANNDAQVYGAHKNATGVSTTGNSPMRFKPMAATASVILQITGTSQFISQSTRTCGIPGSSNACTPPTVPE
ncbi:MAG TPA: DUF2690 domain-containing protein [Thermoanaerobaculia bacterium]|nr:DUF2690 domain-containing protein [Thermoanaerobaculia bacterium]